MRSQALFEESFRADVLELDESVERMIWRVVRRYSELSGIPLPRRRWPTRCSTGVFEQALLRHLAGRPTALADLRANALQVLSHVVCTPATGA